MFWYRSAYHRWLIESQTQHTNPAYTFEVPVLCDPDDNVFVDALPFICMSAIQIVSGKKLSFWRTCIKAVQSNTIPEHGLIGKPSTNKNNIKPETVDALHAFMSEIEQLCDVVPTRFVREKTGRMTTWDDKESALTLPPYWSKRGLYSRFCYDRGWTTSTTHKGVTTLNKRLDWPAGEETEQVVSWPFFFGFWRREYAHISIRRPTADICDDCYLFYNQVKYRKRAPTSPFIPVDSTDDEDNSDSDDESKEQDNGIVTLDWKSEATIQEGDSLETMIEKASKHVKQAKDMRALLIGKAQSSLDWYLTVKELPTITDERWEQAIDCIVGDYCQNLALPYLGEHQPGETYYFSPLTVNCFGLANVGMEKATLSAYIYHEGEGKKGGNNVASLIYKYLDEQGYINRGRQQPRKELNIVMDNCGGQNKNRYVLQLAPLFVELRYYRHVNIIFLVAGHTKNATDRLFNLLKIQYRKNQEFTMEQLEEKLNENQYMECIKV
jgi:hypothetical protein